MMTTNRNEWHNMISKSYANQVKDEELSIVKVLGSGKPGKECSLVMSD